MIMKNKFVTKITSIAVLYPPKKFPPTCPDTTTTKDIHTPPTREGLGEMFEGDSADTCAGKFPLVSMGGRAQTPIGASGNLS